MLLPYMSQQQICPFDALYMPHAQIFQLYQWEKFAEIHATYELNGINHVIRSAVHIRQ